MDCADVRLRLLDAVDGELPSAAADQVRAHLAGCEPCRLELEQIEAGSAALQRALPELAPAERYLTFERFGRLVAAHARGREVVRLVNFRRVLAAAAVAAILISGFVILHTLALTPPAAEAPGPAAVASVPPASQMPIVLASMDHREPMSVMRSLTVRRAGGRARPEREGAVGLIPTSTPGFVVPVEHVFYDAEESSHWW